MFSRNKSSIRQYAVYYAIVIFAVVSLTAVLNYGVYSHYLANSRGHEDQLRLEHSAKNISQFLSVHQAIVDSIAKQISVLDLLAFGSDQDVLAWSKEMQRLLPQSIGLALLDEHGNVKGDHADLRVSDLCRADLRKRIKGLSVNRPPVHHKIERLAHFDLIGQVETDGKLLGLVFASFSVNILTDLLNNIGDLEHAYRIRMPDGYYLSSRLFDEIDETNQREIVIPGTDWVLEERASDEGHDAFLLSLLISNIAAFVLISGVLFAAFKRLFNVIVSDFDSLTLMMHRIQKGVYKSSELPRARLDETGLVLKFMQHAAEELNQYHKRLKEESTTDELTGLFNRRVFNEGFDVFHEQVTDGAQIYLGILDLDRFKQINDRYGHAVGDKVLKAFSVVLKRNCADDDLCVRAGGDEFIVILKDYDKPKVEEWYRQLALEFGEAVVAICEKQALDFETGISAGCTLLLADDYKRDALKRADNALYQVKNQGRHNIAFL